MDPNNQQDANPQQIPPEPQQTTAQGWASPTTPQNQPSSLQPYQQTAVNVTGPLNYGGTPASLVWDGDGHIRLQTIDRASGQAMNAVFDIVPGQIRKASVVISRMTLKTDVGNFYLEFSKSARAWTLAGGLLGMSMAAMKTHDTDMAWWIDNLKRAGVSIKEFTFAKTFLYVFIVLGAIILLAAISAALH